MVQTECNITETVVHMTMKQWRLCNPYGGDQKRESKYTGLFRR